MMTPEDCKRIIVNASQQLEEQFGVHSTNVREHKRITEEQRAEARKTKILKMLITEDEDDFIQLVLDAEPTSPALTPVKIISLKEPADDNSSRPLQESTPSSSEAAIAPES